MSFYQGLILILRTSIVKNSQLGLERELKLSNGNIPCLLHVPKKRREGLLKRKILSIFVKRLWACFGKRKIGR